MPSTKSSNKPTASIPTVEWSFPAIGTTWWIGIYQPVPDLGRLQRTVQKRIDEFDKAYSRFRSDSLISKIASTKGSWKLPPDSTRLLHFYHQLYDITGGRCTPLIGQTMSDAGYDAAYSLQSKVLSTPPRWKDVLDFHGEVLTTTQPVLLDFGAAGKGYLVDLIGELLTQQGIASFCIDAGGDMLYRRSDVTLRVGLEHPDDPSQVVGVAELHGQALCGSAGNRRAWGEYHHIIDPHTLTSPRHIKATWAVATDTMTADGLATALFFTTPQKLRKHFQFEYIIIYTDNHLEYSPAFPGHIFTA